jgi:hypothetical protein
MTIAAALVLIAVGAILRFAVATTATHGFNVHTTGDILMGVGVLGLILWLAIWGRATRGRHTSAPPPPAASGSLPRNPGERPYEDQYPR